MQQNTTIVAAGALIVGVVLGYGGAAMHPARIAPEGMHQMPDGTMMQNNEPMASGMKMDMASMMAGMNAELTGKSGDAFDKAFLSEMVVHHQGAVEMAQLALTSAKHQEIKDLAKGIIAAQTKEIGEMQSWGKTWYNQ